MVSRIGKSRTWITAPSASWTLYSKAMTQACSAQKGNSSFGAGRASKGSMWNWFTSVKERTVKQFTCDYCGKKRYRRHIMASHELHCTLNPNRSCRMCKGKPHINQIILVVKATAKLKGYELASSQIVDFNPTSGYQAPESEVLKQIQELTDSCPACVLAVHRVGGFFTEFVFREACDRWFQEERAEHRQQCQPVNG